MRRWIVTGLVLTLVTGVAGSAAALNVGTEIFVPAAARGSGTGNSMWVTDLYVFNPGTSQVTVDIYWLARGTDNSGATPETYTVNGGETMILADVIQTVFGLNSAGGAFRIVADAEVMVNSRIYNLASSGDTFGQGFEGVPASSAISAGSDTDFVGLTDNGTGSGTFRTNIFAVNTNAGSSTVTFYLLDASGSQVASRSYTMQPYAALYKPVSDLGGGSFDEGTVHAEVAAGSAIVVGSKIDNGSGDPTTLEAWWTATPGIDGTYQFAIYDSAGYATGGSLTVSGGTVGVMEGTYVNYDKIDAGGDPECTLIFYWGGSFDPPLTTSELEQGVTWTTDYGDGYGSMEWTVQLQLDGGLGFTGTLEATGSNFEGQDTGCNGEFPVQTVLGGRS